jgi:hypothetical protein
MNEAPVHFRGPTHSTNTVHATSSSEMGSTVFHLFAENLLVPITPTFTPATPMPSAGGIFLYAFNVMVSYFLTQQYQSRRCTNDVSACQHLLFHFESQPHFNNTPQMSLTQCDDDVSTTFAKGKIESIAMVIIARRNEDLLTGARILVPQTPHISLLTNVHSGSLFVADHALSM